jgi:CubicO group peptidase (beta-lactamase class C family)
MKPYSFLTICCICFRFGYGQITVTQMRTFVDAAHEANLFNGVVLVARHDSILFTKGYGWRDYEKHLPHDINSIFRIGSLTQSFTATVILHLQEQGKLRISDTLSKYFPEYAPAGQIIIRNLLTHTSGISDYTHEDGFYEEQAFQPYGKKDFWKYIQQMPLDFPPNSEYGFSHSNYFILGCLIEKVTGKPYEQVVRETIINKTGMVHSGFNYTHIKSKYKAVGYEELNDKVHMQARVIDSGAAYASEGMYSTVGDLFRYYKALFSYQLISQPLLEEALTPYKEGYGYGLNIVSWGNTPVVGNKGAIFGFQSLFCMVPDCNTYMIALSNNHNVSNDPECDLNFIGGTFFKIVVDHSTTHYIPRKAITADASALTEYVGAYKKDTGVNNIMQISVTNGRLQAALNGRSENELFSEKKDHFFLKNINCQVEFKRGADGKVKELLVYFNRQVARYRK